MNNRIFFLSVLFLTSLIMIFSCNEDVIFDENEIPLEFSIDTLRFDTVFTEIGSTTKFIRIFNPNDGAVIVDDITLLSQQTDFFRLNIDGYAENSRQEVRIEAQDSLYIFAEVTIDPNQPLDSSPFIIEDQISISANNSEYTIYLEAFGQNANYIPNRMAKSQINRITCNMSTWTWDDPKPYVIFGALLIDSCELIIPAGTDVYVHGGIAINELGIYNDGLLLIQSDGTLTTNGTPDNPVTIQTDRLEEEFADVPGQWSGIIISAGSQGNTVNHTNIRHSITGLSIDSSASLRLISSSIGYTSGPGLSSSNSNIYAENCLFFENLGAGADLSFGGGYQFNHCTFANYNNQGSAIVISNRKCSDPLCQERISVARMDAFMNNCIFVGNQNDEVILIDQVPDRANFFNYTFNNCIVSVDEILNDGNHPDFFSNCNDCLNVTRNDTLFLDLTENDFSLDTLSIAIDAAQYLNTIPLDILGNLREINNSDVGCYEFQK